jgi:hypothetical protein
MRSAGKRAVFRFLAKRLELMPGLRGPSETERIPIPQTGRSVFFCGDMRRQFPAVRLRAWF